MSGTSLDGIDSVLVDFSESQPKLVATYFQAYPKDLYLKVKTLCRSNCFEFDELGIIDARLGLVYAEVVNALLNKSDFSSTNIKAIGSHGQTVQHSPNAQNPYTIQLGDPSRISENTNISVVADFRRRDIAAGGEGAPLVPAFHQSIFHNERENRCVLNIGGIANITFLPSDTNQTVIGFDCGPGNTLLDQWCQTHLNMDYDSGGALCKTGTVLSDLLNSLLSDPYFQKNHPKSTGPEYFNLKWLTSHLKKYPSNPLDVLTTLCELSATSIANSIKKLPLTDRILVCGGGAHNEFLLERIKARLTAPLEITTKYGIHPDWVEATAFAWLAKQTIEGKPGNLPSVTGANKAVVLGAIYPA
jgi:anhydro-N-acetylmuramic acid kinase